MLLYDTGLYHMQYCRLKLKTMEEQTQQKAWIQNKIVRLSSSTKLTEPLRVDIFFTTKMADPTGPTHHHPRLVICPSKALPILFTKMRDERTTSAEFVYYSKRAMRLVAEEALAEFPTTTITVKTPCAPYEGLESIDPGDICAVSIVRSGDSLLEIVRDLIPSCAVGKILIQRDETHPRKLPKLFHHKLPPKVKDMYILLCDPMLATGGSAVTALDVLVKGAGVDPRKIIFANMICAPQGLRACADAYPDVKIVTAVVDPKLNEQKFIVPGVGDYGDRFFNTGND